jgi:hypothetical protein
VENESHPTSGNNSVDTTEGIMYGDSKLSFNQWGFTMSYINKIKKLLGKRRMAKIVEVDAYGMPLMVDIVMKEGWFYDDSETLVVAEWEGDPERETWGEFVKYLKMRVDSMQYKPELEESYQKLPPKKNDDLWLTEIMSGLKDTPTVEIKCNKPNCDYCG